MNKTAGFSLIELMITVVIISIITSFAVPSYLSHVRESKRTDATTALLRLAAEQEKWYNQNNTYTSDLTDLKSDTTKNDYYDLLVVTADTTEFEAKATVKTGGPQAKDDMCKVFTIDSTGQRKAYDSTNSLSNHCWK